MTLARLRDRLRMLWRETRSSLLIVATLALAGGAIGAAIAWRGAVDVNTTIAALRGGRDAQVDVNSRPELVLAQIADLARRSEIDRARVLMEVLDRRGRSEIRARGHYLLANALLRQAFEHIERSELEAAGPFVNLAKREYRGALQLLPEFWDAKYNIDVAARLVRDFPEFERNNGDELGAEPKKLWTDIPGKPKGLP